VIGQTISHYKIIEKLGEGGMGVVYKAEDIRLKRIVALKFLPQDASVSDRNKSMFIKEAQAASALNHPNIAHIYEIDEASGETFIAMEFIEGKMLRDVINAGQMNMSEIVKISVQIANGLFAAHTKGIVHRDIKPENIMILTDGTAKITDFGLAKTTELTRETEDNKLCGTLAYMSPEQLRGDSVHHTTDIWSLGVVLYEMVSGKLPFIEEYEQAVVYSILNTKHASVTTLRTDISLTLERIIDKCLEKKPSARYQTAKELVEEFRRYQSEVTDGQKIKAILTKTIAVLPFADISNNKDNKYFSDGLTEEIITNLSKLQMLKVVPRSSVMRYEKENKTHKETAKDLGVQYLLEGSVRKQSNDLRITAQLIDAAQDSYLWAETYRGTIEDIFDIQEKVAAKIVHALQLQLSPDEKQTLTKRFTDNTEAYQLYLQGRYFWNRRTEEGLKLGLKYFEKAIENDPSYALAWAGLADTYNLLGEYGRTTRRELFPKAKMAAQKALEIDNQLAEAHISLASLLMLNDWDWGNAEKEFLLGLELNPNYATGHHWYAMLLLYLGRSKDAYQEISLAAELDPISQAILKDKGLVLYYQKEYDKAIDLAQKALELDVNFATSHRLLSLAYQGKGMVDQAIAENKRWGILTGNHIDTAIALAHLYAIAGRKEEALKIIEGLSAADLLRGNIYRGIALVYTALGDKDMAFKFLEQGIDLREESLSSINIDPKFDRLRADPRFNILLKKIGLEP